MRILLLVNNWVGWQVTRWLHEQGEDIAGLVLHPPARARYREEILASAHVGSVPVFDAAQLRQPEALQAIRQLDADMALSIFFGYILRPAFIDLFPAGVINLHPSYLPYNRGAHPNVWSIVEGTPAGATLHYIDSGIDTGDIIARQAVAVTPTDTGATLYAKLLPACLELFQHTWPQIRAAQVTRMPQDSAAGTHHFVREIEQIDRIDLDATYRARDLLNLLRARTFPPYRGAYFEEGDRRVYLRLQLLTEALIDEEISGNR